MSRDWLEYLHVNRATTIIRAGKHVTLRCTKYIASHEIAAINQTLFSKNIVNRWRDLRIHS
jgi:hypothetical protein